MPPLPSPGQVIKATCLHSLGPDTHAGSHFYLSYGGGTPSTSYLNNLSDEISILYSTNLAGLLNTAFALNFVQCQDLSSSSGLVGSFVASVAGTRTGTNLPLNCCTRIDYLIARHYRGGKPGGYWPFGSITDMTSDTQWTSAFQSAVNADFGAFMAALLAYSASGITLNNHVNVSYYSGFTNYTGSGGRAKVRNNLRGTPAVDNITTHKTRVTISSQRRRLTAS